MLPADLEQCRLLGQQIVETRPRQCLLPDNNLLLETDEPPTLASARIGWILTGV